MLPLTYYYKELTYKSWRTPIPGNTPSQYVSGQVQVYGYRQGKPYNLMTSMTKIVYKTLYGEIDCSGWWWSSDSTDASVVARNQSRAKFVGKLGEACQWGSTLTTERARTWRTVVDIVTRCAKAARHVTRLELLSAANTLGLPYNETTKRIKRYRYEWVSRKNGLGRRRVKTKFIIVQQRFSFGTGRDYLKNVANGWLMWSYGVKPLMDDIYRGMDVLQRPMPVMRVKGTGSGLWSNRIPDGNGNVHRLAVDAKVFCSAKVQVDNPNLWLANQMGLINPVQMINEGIPFSFVADWFSNLSQVIQQWTDFVGLTVSDPCMLDVSDGTQEFLVLSGNPYIVNQGKTCKTIKRSLALPTAVLHFAPERFQLQRGLNAISLLMGFLPGRR